VIPRFAVRHPVTVAMIFIATALLGYLSLRELPVDLLPELEAPRIAVLVTSGDRPPEELEDAYAQPIERSLSTLSGVRRVRTVTSTGRVLAAIEYEWGEDMDFAQIDVEKAVSVLKTDRDVDSVLVRRFDPSTEPIVVLALREDLPEGRPRDPDALDRLRRLAEDRVAPALELVEGVASAQVAGGRKSEVRVTVERHRLKALGLSFDQLSGLIQQGNAEASGGTVEDAGKVHVIKGLGAYESLEDVASLPLSVSSQSNAGGPSRPLRLDEIATVEWIDAPVRGLVTIDGEEGVSLSIYKESGENTVAVSDRVRAAVKELSGELRAAELQVVTDQAGFIRDAIRQVQWAALAGIVLAVLVLFAFLRSGKAVLLVGLAIPLSIIATFALMAFGGLTLNLMTLGGLALGAGMLIDNAIVVLEAIFRRMEEGSDSFTAAEEGASEVAGAILAATLTTCVVFLPVSFLHGVAAELFTDLAFTVVFSLLCSLAVALLLIPMAAARLFVGRAGERAAEHGPRSHSVYERVLSGLLKRPTTVIMAALIVVAAASTMVPRLGLDFLPTSDPGEITARVLLPEGTRVTVTERAVRSIEASVRQAVPGAIATSLAELGEAVREEVALTDEIPAENRGVLRIKLVPSELRSVSTEEVERLLDEAASHLEGVALRLEPADPVLGKLFERGPPLRIEVRGQDLLEIERGSEAVAESLRGLPELFNVRSSFEDRRAEIRLQLDRTVVAGLGLTPDGIAQQLRQRLGAEAATSFRRDDEDRDVVVSAPQYSLRRLPDLVLDAGTGDPVRLGDLAELSIVSSPTRIERSLGSRFGVISAQAAEGRTLGEASLAIEQAMATVQLPPGVRSEVTGAESIRKASFDELLFAVVLAIVLVYMVMASLFESVVHPFTILFTLPTAGVGVVLGLWLTDTPFSVPALLGAVMLAGIAVNNGILLVDLTGRLRRQGLSRREALARAGGMRLRPILMTSLTTVLAMLPLALGQDVYASFPWTAGWGEGAELRVPMAVTVIGGLAASTLLTLVLVPAVYDLLDRLRPAGRRDG
jgi:HAE1 family hydrophobic/amphiphilic exporter-1